MKKTVFVVGAGASTDFGLPLGSELAERIRVDLDQDFGSSNAQNGPIATALMSEGLLLQHVEAAQVLRGALLRSRSIDHALFTLRDRPFVIQVGKIAIARQILLGEGKSPLPNGWITDRHLIHEGLNRCRQSWLARLFVTLLEDRAPEEFESAFSNVAFITFNYDRCIEQYLFYALRDIGSLSKEQAAGIVKGVPVAHVYGYPGKPQFLGGQQFTDFGSDRFAAAAAAAKTIKTYTEGAEAGTLTEVQRLIGWAERVVFLGFGFDPLNMSVLYPEGAIKEQILWGTALHLDPDERRRLAKHVFNNPDHPLPAFVEMNCGEFVRTRAKPLMAG